MYTNMQSLCYTLGTNTVLHVNYTSKRKERSEQEGKLDKDSQKVKKKKKKKKQTQKDVLPRTVGAQYVTGEVEK